MVGDTKGSEVKTAEVVLLWEVYFYKTAGGGGLVRPSVVGLIVSRRQLDFLSVTPQRDLGCVCELREQCHSFVDDTQLLFKHSCSLFLHLN